MQKKCVFKKEKDSQAHPFCKDLRFQWQKQEKKSVELDVINDIARLLRKDQEDEKEKKIQHRKKIKKNRKDKQKGFYVNARQQEIAKSMKFDYEIYSGRRKEKIAKKKKKEYLSRKDLRISPI